MPPREFDYTDPNDDLASTPTSQWVDTPSYQSWEVSFWFKATSGATAIALLGDSEGRSKPMAWYRYLFFKLTEWLHKTHGSDDLPEYTSILGLSIFATLNALSALMVAGFLVDGLLSTANAKVFAVGVWITSVAAHWALLIRGDRLARMEEEFPGEASSGRQFAAWSYPVATIVVFFLLGSLRS